MICSLARQKREGLLWSGPLLVEFPPPPGDMLASSVLALKQTLKT